MSKPYVGIFSKDWYDEMWGRMVIAIGRGEGRSELVGILQYVAQDRYSEGLAVGQKIAKKEGKS